MNINIKETEFRRVGDITIPTTFSNRITSGIDRIDSMFGGGLIPGSCITIHGSGGTGKSTIILQILSLMDKAGCEVAYATGEESSEQIAFTCERLGINNIDLAHIKDVDHIVSEMENYDIMVIDSFQSLKRPKGMKISEFKEYAQNLLISKAKETGCILIFVLHITTGGLPKGGTDIIHAVDMNIKMSIKDENVRVFDIYKNRGGSTGKHLFNMTQNGFDFNEIKEVSKVDISHWVSVIGDYLRKCNNKKLKFIGRFILSIEKILKIVKH
jgi:DNA repair protein RadA/Sms